MERIQIQHTLFLTKLLLNQQKGLNGEDLHNMVSDHLAEINLEYQKQPGNDIELGKHNIQDSFSLNKHLIGMISQCQNNNSPAGQNRKKENAKESSKEKQDKAHEAPA